jgi:lysophospholipid acyltransferase (LPLAT)-like uncharacterized protein
MLSKLFKKNKHKQLIHILVAFLAVIYVRIVFLTSRITYDLPVETKPYINGGNPAIFALWHNRVLLIPALNHSKLPIYALVSNHSDGRLIGRVLRYFGFSVIYGSTSKGGVQAMRQMINIYESGHHIAITPDGPRGPNQVAGAGVAQLAIITGAPVLCISSNFSRCFRLNSWDKFIIPLPFSHVHFTYSLPIIASGVGKEYREELRLQIETELNRLSEVALQKISSDLENS